MLEVGAKCEKVTVPMQQKGQLKLRTMWYAEIVDLGNNGQFICLRGYLSGSKPPVQGTASMNTFRRIWLDAKALNECNPMLGMMFQMPRTINVDNGKPWRGDGSISPGVSRGVAA